MSKVKPCVACARPMSVAFLECPFCGAEQPKLATSARGEKAQRCPTCTRLYSTTFDTCPFCADEPRGEGAVPYRGSAREAKPAEPMRFDVPEADDFRGKGLAAGLALLLVLGGGRGLMVASGSERLGGQESSGLFFPCLVAGLVLGLGAGFVLSRAIDAFGEPGGFKVVVFLAAFATAPCALTVYALLDAVNGIGAAGRERDVVCEVLYKDRHSRRGTDLGWRLGYACEIDDFGTLIGTYTSHAEPPGLPKGHVTFRASPGLLGLWIRRGEPVGPMPPTPHTKLPFPVHVPVGAGHSGPARP